jgi:hypothetical protein
MNVETEMTSLMVQLFHVVVTAMPITRTAGNTLQWDLTVSRQAGIILQINRIAKKKV